MPAAKTAYKATASALAAMAMQSADGLVYLVSPHTVSLRIDPLSSSLPCVSSVDPLQALASQLHPRAVCAAQHPAG